MRYYSLLTLISQNAYTFMPSVTSVFYPNQQNVFYFINQVCLHGMCTWSFTTKASECCL